MKIVIYVDSLSHHGVKGMKWGVRRYQKKDGSPTRLGQKRINKGFKDAEKLGNSFASIEDYNRVLAPAVARAKQQNAKLLVPTDVKQEFTRRLAEYETTHGAMNKKYKNIVNSVITENGRQYAYVLLTDKKTGNGYEWKAELKNQ